MGRARWIAGSALKVEDFQGEFADLESREAKHQVEAHRGLDNAPAAVGARVRAVDGSVELSMTVTEQLPAPQGHAATTLRGWVVSVGSAILSLNWAAGGRIAAHLRGVLSCRTLDCREVKFSEAIAEPAAAQPFRMFRRAANRKDRKPEALVIELAAPLDPEAARTNPPPGMQVGGMTAQGFVPLLEMRPGRGVIIRGNYNPKRELLRKPPADGPSDAALVAAFLRTDAGKAARGDIEKKAQNIGLVLDPPRWADERGGLVELSWTIKNVTTMTLKSLRVMAAVMPDNAKIAPVWIEQPPSVLAGGIPTTALAPDQPATGNGSILIEEKGKKITIGLLLVAEADYSVPVTKLDTKGFSS